MQTPTKTTPYKRCMRLARHLLRMLGKFSGRNNLEQAAHKVEAARDEWIAARSACDAAEEALDDARTDMLFAEHTVDQLIRKLKKAVGIADGGARGGRIEAQVFPDGLAAEVDVQGLSQAKALENLGNRLGAIKPIWAEAGTWYVQVQEQHVMYQATLNARTAAERAFTQCLIQRDAARERFITAYVEASKLVGAEFPREKKTTEMFFGKVRAASRSENDEDDEDDEPIS